MPTRGLPQHDSSYPARSLISVGAYRDKLLSIGVIGRRSRPVVREGRQHPDSGAAWKAVSTEAGTTVEHNVKGDRVDAYVRPETLRVERRTDA